MSSRRQLLAAAAGTGIVSLTGCTELLNSSSSDYTYRIMLLNAIERRTTVSLTARTDAGDQLLSEDYTLDAQKGDSTDRFSTAPDQIVVETDRGQFKEFRYDTTDCPGNNATISIYFDNEILAAGSCGTITAFSPD